MNAAERLCVPEDEKVREDTVAEVIQTQRAVLTQWES